MRSSLLTVAITTHNRRSLLKEAIDSVLSQTFSDFRVMIFDNASNDGTDKLISNIQEQDDRIEYIRHKYNLGWHKNVYLALTTPKTQYVAWLMDDDIWLPNHLEQGLKQLEATPEAALYASAAEYFGAGRVGALGLGSMGIKGKPICIDFRNDFTPMLVGNPFVGSAIIARSRSISQIRRWYRTTAIDWLISGQLCLEGTVVFNPTPTVRYRWHQSNLSHQLLGTRLGTVHHRFVLRVLAKDALQSGRLCLDRLEHCLLDEWAPPVAAAAIVALSSFDSDRELRNRLINLFRHSPQFRQKVSISGHCRLAARIGSRYLRYADVIDRVRVGWRNRPI